MQFFRFLELFLAAAERGPAAAWEFLFSRTSYEFSEIQMPEQLDHVVVFLKKMRLMIVAEGKGSSARRAEAINRLIQYVSVPCEDENEYFRNRIKWQLCFQLAIRVREPKFIDQRRIPICGPNSVAIAWARDRPCEYVTAALELHDKGQCELDGGHFLVRFSMKNAVTCWAGKMAYADVLVMGAIKNRMDFGKLEQMLNNETPMHGNGGDRVCRLLQVIGCEVFEDHATVPLYPATFPHESQHRRLLTDCCEAVRDRRNIVLICYNSDSINSSSRHRDYHGYQRGDFGGVPVIMPPPQNHNTTDVPVIYANPQRKSKESANHWSILCKMTLQGAYVEFKVYTWGRVVRGRMLIEQFLKMFNGYVVGRFPDRN